MCAALEACQELEHEEPNHHNNNRDDSDNIEPVSPVTDAEDPAIEEQSAEFDAGKGRCAQDIPCYLKL